MTRLEKFNPTKIMSRIAKQRYGGDWSDDKIIGHYSKLFDDNKKELINLRLRQYNVDSDVLSLECIKPLGEYQSDVIEKFLSISLDTDFRLPYLYGPPGTGKSYLSDKFARFIIKGGVYNVKKYNIPELFVNNRDYFKSSRMVDLLSCSEVLFMDDLFTHNSTKSILEVIHVVLDKRLREKKHTLITSNIPINEVGSTLYKTAVGGVSKMVCYAIEDRLYDLCSIKSLKGYSIRQNKAVKRFK